MPNCSKCKVELALCAIGVMCPKCGKHYSPHKLYRLKDYDFDTCYRLMTAFLSLMDMGDMGKQLYYLHELVIGIGVIPLNIYYK